MKVGSIVVVKKLPPPSPRVLKYIKWLPKDDENTPYVIRAIDKDDIGTMAAIFEEGIIGIHEDGGEFGIGLNFLREILPPEKIEIDEIIEETNLSTA